MKQDVGLTIRNAVKAILMAAPGVATSVHAQQAPSASRPDDLQEIVVTGTSYRPDNQTTATGLALPLIETPQSISIISDEMMKQFNIQSTFNAVDMVPGASEQINGFGQQRVIIRGTTTVQRVDGIQDANLFLDSYALERVEVVRGPATVLYGITGAFGGEFNQILKRPSNELHANVGYRAGDFAMRRLEGDVSGPIPATDDRLKGRLVGYYTNYGDPQITPVHINNVAKFWMGDLSYEISPSTTATLTALEDNRSIDPMDGCPQAETANKVLYIPTSIPAERWYCNNPRNWQDKIISQYQLLDVTQKFDRDWTLEFQANHQKSTSALDYVFGLGPAGSGLPSQDVYLYSYAWRLNSTSVTANLTLGGNFGLFGHDNNQFFAALEYLDGHSNRYNFFSFGLGTMNMFTGGGQGVLANGSQMPAIPPDRYISDSYGAGPTWLGSVQFLLHPLERWDVLAGALGQHFSTHSLYIPASGNPSSGGLTQTLWVPRLALTYKLVPNEGPLLTDARTYLSFSKGVLPNVGIFDSQKHALTSPQENKSFELGLKATWLKRLDGSVDVFHSYITNVPTKTFIFNGMGGNFAQTLGGKNTYNGVDAQLIGKVLPGWNVDLAYAYTRARRQDGRLPYEINVANQPKEQASLFTSYELIAGPLRGLLGGVGVVWKGDVPLVDNPSYIQRCGCNTSNQLAWSATRVDFRLSYQATYGSLKGLSVYGNVINAFNTKMYSNGSGDPRFSNQISAPRAITGGVSYSF